MSGDETIPQNDSPERTDGSGNNETKQMTSELGITTGGNIKGELRSKLSMVRNAKTFIKSASKGSKPQPMTPIPWPMPTRKYEEKSSPESSTTVLHKRDTDREYLTPQSSFEPDEADIARHVDSLARSEPYHEGSGAFSLESEVRQESDSSLGHGVSLALADSGDSASSESVSKVDIDDDEFTHFLSDKTNSSHSSVDFTQLFKAEEQIRRHGENVCNPLARQKSSSELSATSSTPKAIRVPFGNRKSLKSGANTVSLAEALEVSSSLKDVRNENSYSHTTESSRPMQEGKEGGKEKKLSECNDIECEGRSLKERSSKLNSVQTQPSPVEDEIHPKRTNSSEHGNPSGLRRPMASRRKTFVVLPGQREGLSSEEHRTEDNRQNRTKTQQEKNTSSGIQEVTQRSNVVETTPPAKGVIVRAHSYVSHVAGIRRAETGRIMSRAELRERKTLILQESPNPKSLNPAAFSNEEEEEVTTVNPSTLFPESSSESDEVVTEQTSINNMQATTEQFSANGQSSSNRPMARTDDGSFLSPGILSRKKKFGAEEYRVDSFQFSEHDGSSGLLNRFSSGFRKMQMAVAKKPNSHEVSQAARSGIVVPGTIDEAVCKICVVCRKQLEYGVYVKDTGKKIKVESRKERDSRYLRATLLVRQLPGASPHCEVNIRQSRSDSMKTNLATLWNFYQRLEAGLKELG